MTATLRELIVARGGLKERRLCDVDKSVDLEQLLSTLWLDVPLENLRGNSVLIATAEQFATACALIMCDGIAKRLVICPPGISAEHIRTIADVAEIDAVICDDAGAENPLRDCGAIVVRVSPPDSVDSGKVSAALPLQSGSCEPSTEWVMLTSGTSGAPKMVIHTLDTLTNALTSAQLGLGSNWSTFYDIRRYGGLQIFLRAMVCGGTMILSSAQESSSGFLERASKNGVTHISGTPSHWRRALMSRSDHSFAPKYVRLSGEIADQAILDRLRTAFGEARISHAFASTEAGVAFDVVDGFAGFPASLVGIDGEVTLRVVDGTLRIRSGRTAIRYVGLAAPPIGDVDGFVDTGDIVELCDGRYVFVGRSSGIINVGGQKIHPEEIEAVILLHPRVQMCVVNARRNPILGAIVVAEVVTDLDGANPKSVKELADEVISHCRERLPRYKVPVSVLHVSALEFSDSGKMRR
jgi:acyl-coenzyme A synthetase/AMP-(fatty) acid ligase